MMKLLTLKTLKTLKTFKQMNKILNLIDRKRKLFDFDIVKNNVNINNIVAKSRFLVIGGAGSIGQAVVKEIFWRNPSKLHVVDINENNLTELVRDIRSSLGYIEGEFKTFSLDVGSLEYDAFIKYDGKYDYVLNLSALEHVRSEEDPFTLMRMIDVNILNTDKTIKQSIENGTKKYFCVSTDKAANPINMMGASKRIMEMFLMRRSLDIDISTARVANPVNNYAKSKLLGEQEVLENCKDALVIRTNFYGWGTKYRQSFSDFILNKLKNNEQVDLFSDVFFTPILIDELSKRTHQLIDAGAIGVFNVVSSERVSKYEFGIKLANCFNLDVSLINAVSISHKSDLVKRPKDMSLSNNKLCQTLNCKISSISKQIQILKQQEGCVIYTWTKPIKV